MHPAGLTTRDALWSNSLRKSQSYSFPPLVDLTAEQAPLRELFEKHPFLPYNKNGNFTV